MFQKECKGSGEKCQLVHWCSLDTSSPKREKNHALPYTHPLLLFSKVFSLWEIFFIVGCFRETDLYAMLAKYMAMSAVNTEIIKYSKWLSVVCSKKSSILLKGTLTAVHNILAACTSMLISLLQFYGIFYAFKSLMRVAPDLIDPKLENSWIINESEECPAKQWGYQSELFWSQFPCIRTEEI